MLKNLRFKALIISFLPFISYFLFPASVVHALTKEIASQPVSEGTAQPKNASVDSQQTGASAPAEEIPSDTSAPEQTATTQAVNSTQVHYYQS
ncbi:MAG: hypothetical protein NG784_07900 [Candidatus Jettenia sp.]|nr:hypothetical protein [Candidatus Jettenia sp.]